MRIEDYLDLIGAEPIARIYAIARRMYQLRVLNVNATYHGGGVAGMLQTIVPLLNEIGLDVDWSLLYGEPDLFQATKKLHNGLQGERVTISDDEIALYLRINEAFARYTPIVHDVVIVHDPQPLPMIAYRNKEGPWIWRCHIDLSNPNEDVWEKLKPYVLRYDAVVVSSESFKKADLPVDTHVIPPAIDPFSAINRPLTDAEVAAKLAEYNIPHDKPLIVQVSRFDKWKDPLGVLEVFSRVRKETDTRLVMLGNMASDDPEGPVIYEQVAKRAAALHDVHLITATDPVLVNALQRAATVIMQLSLKEGFGLTVSEALWKGTPVVATNVGGIPLQIEDGKTGYLVAPQDYEAMSARVLDILNDPNLRTQLGTAGREHVREKFLMPRLLTDWLTLLKQVILP